MHYKKIAHVSVALAAVGLAGCPDAEQQAKKLFTDQGLTLIQPVRDYISLGGMVLVPRNGRPTYIDPLDSVTSANGTASNFKGIVMAQTRQKDIDFGLATSLIAKLIPVPIGLKASSNTNVRLAQIDTSGVRVPSQALESLVRAPNTEAFALREIPKGARLFMIQEVYLSTGLDVTSSAGTALNVSLGDGQIAQCAAKSGDKPAAAGDGEKPATNAQAPEASKDPRGATDTKKATPSATTTPASGSTAPASDASADSKPKLAVGLGVCRISAATLSFTSATNMPFAVRLSEIVLDNAKKKTEIKYGTFKFPGTLGDSPVEKTTAVINPAEPTLAGLERFQPPR